MKYFSSAANGKSGEYYFAYWITRNFGWPCRLLDIDIGIDAQVEIIDEEKHSTGNFIAVQIKSTQESNPNVSVDLDNLNYWKAIDDAVILVSIVLKTHNPKIYWKPINNSLIEEYIIEATKNKGKTTTVHFKEHNLLVNADKKAFIELPYGGEILKLNKKIEKLENDCSEINAISPPNPSKDFSFSNSQDLDYESINPYIHIFDRACKLSDEIEHITTSMPKVLSLFPKYENVIEAFNLAIENMRVFIAEVSVTDVDNNYEIGRYWKKSGTHPIVFEIFEEEYPNLN